ncbi:MAG: patatin-like phospholipase family protein [Acidobacteriota bacterium]
MTWRCRFHPFLTRSAAGVVLAMALAAASPVSAWAQTDIASPETVPLRPRLGLALGGGAARGFAHIGILKWFEEHRIPVDAIAGTSMGGLIGGAFATGMTPAEIEQLVVAIPWDRMLAPGAPFPDKSFRRKQDARAFPSGLEFGLRHGFSLPAGLSTGQQVDLLLGRIAMPYYATTDFDQLPTPFRCVAADLKKSDVVVFAGGWLAQALRATMAIPGVFAPVIDGGRVMVDGGILNNVPADVAASMGADVVIAVDVSSDLDDNKRGGSLLTVLGESLDVMMRAGSRRALEKATFVITPALKGLFAVDFDRVGQFIQLGYEAAEAQRRTLEQYSVSETAYQSYRAARANRRLTRLPAPAFVDVEGVPSDEAEAIRGRLNRFVLAPFDTAGLDRQMIAIVGTERYLSMTYRLVVSGERVGILVTGRPKTYGPPFLIAALELQNNPSTGIAATARGRVWLPDVTGHGSEVRLDVAVGTQMRLAGEWYEPIGHGGLFVASHAGADRRQFNVFAGKQYRAEYRQQAYQAGVDAGFVLGNLIEWRAGYTVEHVDGHTLIGDPVLPSIDGVQRYLGVQAAYDGQTGPTVPERGVYARARLRRFVQTAAVLSAESLQAPRADPDHLWSGEVDTSIVFPVSRPGRIFVRASGGSSFGSTARVNAFTLGGPFALGALNIDELRGSNYGLAVGGYLHQIYRFAQGAAGSVYLGSWVETGAVFERWAGTSVKANLSGGMIVETLLGPISAGASVGRDGRYRLYAGMGPLLHR